MNLHKLLVAAALVLAVVTTSGCATGTGGPPKAKGEYRVEIDNAYGLVRDGDVRIAGAKSGHITGFELTPELPARAIVKIELNRPGFTSLRGDARCSVRMQSWIGEYYLDCQPGANGKLLKPGALVPVAHTQSVIPFDLVQNVMRQPYRERMRILINELGAGLAGRPQDVNDVIHRAFPALNYTDQVLEVLAREHKLLNAYVRETDPMVAALARSRGAVAQSFTETARSSELMAKHPRRLAAGFANLAQYLALMRKNSDQWSALADQQVPMTRDLGRIAKPLDDFMKESTGFVKGSLPDLKVLGELSKIGTRALRNSRDENETLTQFERHAPALGRPLRQLLQSMDSRDRSAEPDSRAAASAPPAPDPTSRDTSKGFTGFESLMNFIYDTTLTLNGFDELGHFLRAVTTTNDCSPYVTRPSKALIANCASWLGPNQPGITTPDPTPGASPRTEAQRSGMHHLARLPNYADLGTLPTPEEPRGPSGGGGTGESPKLPSLPALPGVPPVEPPPLPVPPNLPGSRRLPPPPQGTDREMTALLDYFFAN